MFQILRILPQVETEVYSLCYEWVERNYMLFADPSFQESNRLAPPSTGYDLCSRIV